MNLKFKIAHFSDMHFGGEKDREKTNCSHSNKLLKKIEEYINSNRDELDLIIFSGDLTEVGDYNSFDNFKQWVFSKDPDEKNGLKLDFLKVGIVPGNHDAFNAQSESILEILKWRQKSLKNYNRVLEAYAFNPTEKYRYDWIEKNGHGIFIVYVDSCFLGSKLKGSWFGKPFNAIFGYPHKEIAKGKFSIEQSQHLLDLTNRGLSGKLVNPRNENVYIDKNLFRGSLKILVMHHYLFEPTNLPSNYLMRIEQRKTVAANIWMSEFDILLCGHKHVPDFKPHSIVGDSENGIRNRYIKNYFRNLIGISSLPIQHKDKDGNKLTEAASSLINFLFRIQLEKDSKSIDPKKTVKILNSILENPKDLESKIKEYLEDIESKEIIDMEESEIREIGREISSSLTQSSRDKLSELAKKMQNIVSRFPSRDLLQIICGSSGKNLGWWRERARARSFNVYTIEKNEKEWILHCDKFNWNEKTFNPEARQTHIFKNSRHLNYLIK